ncbi:hypothetical protein HPB51_003375 [Rhipicephalus microplus]|uniref:PiggyBac transposable element-derived protein domain-containing protein n=1 Tax=Rhipicephalus microplus TaxID=6941 RepID=A0A9J6D3U5_RHIMP|nr:hypothetical protein HPB51_003375 [Rhipicephalus microplus]
MKFQLYKKKKGAHKLDDATLNEHVVLTLTDGAISAGSRVFFDNFFSSTKLLQVLREKDILACGQFGVNKKDLTQVVKENKKLERGSYTWRRKAEVAATQWRDSKNVHLMSNYHDPEDRVQALIVHDGNPTALEAKRIKNSKAVVILFDGLKVPNHAICGVSMFLCTLFRSLCSMFRCT